MLSLRTISDLSLNSIDASDVAVVVAHPDDETIGCGALLSRLENVTVILVTDGSPCSGADALRAGFETPLAYGQARSRELKKALAVAGVDETQIIELGVPDQKVCRSLASISQRLASLFESKGITTVLTHAFEGGHPDHDGVALCVHAAGSLLKDRAPTLIEMPYYHLEADRMAAQTFCDGEDEIVVAASPHQRQIKMKMMAAHASQSETLRAFSAEVERYRRARPYDFRTLPNGGRIFYSRFDCGFHPHEWSPLACKALRAIELEGEARSRGALASIAAFFIRSGRRLKLSREARIFARCRIRNSGGHGSEAQHRDERRFSMTPSNAKIQGYIASELQNEIIELERRIAVLETCGTPPSTFLVRKLKEFYWTVTRLSGFGHWHEGLTAEEAALVNGKRNLNLFPGATCERLNGVSFAQPGQRLLIDVTDTISCGFVSGVQRVVRQLAKGAMESGVGIPVFIQDGELCYLQSSTAPKKIEIVEGDKFIMADASWNDVPACRKAMERTSRRGGSNIVILHDIHPLLYPGLFHPDNVRNCLSWFDAIVLNSDALVAVSKSAAEEFLAYVVANEKTVNPKMLVGWQHLGADFEIEIDEAPSPQIMHLCAGGAPFFLSVSTLEPKKGYTIALDAMEHLWERGVDARYIIVGRYGWNTHALERRIRSHPEFNKRLFWLGQVSDADLQHLYKNAHSLIFASVAEGFGLPLIEAANFGLPAIVSDIPVFREVGDGVASYFEVADSESLAMRLDEALLRKKASNALPPILKWRQSTDELFKLIKTNAYQFGAQASERGGQPRRGPLAGASTRRQSRF